MSEKLANPVSSGASQTAASLAVPRGPSGGKPGSGGGNMSPVQQASIRAQNLDEVVQRLNVRSRSVGTALRFRVDSVSGSSVIQVLDRDTGELIRQIPPKEASALFALNGDRVLQLLDDRV